MPANEYNNTPTASTYQAGSAAQRVFDYLNAARLRCGFGGLNANAQLDLASKNHSSYLIFNNRLGDGHYETDSALPFYTGRLPWERIRAAGYDYSRTSEELVLFSSLTGSAADSAVLDGVKSLMMAPYHMAGMFDWYRDVGIDMATSASVKAATPGLAGLVLKLGVKSQETQQRRADNQVVTYPCGGITDTATSLFNESPHPFPGRDLSKNPIGQPVLVQVNADSTLNLTSATMTEVATGQALEMRILTGVFGESTDPLPASKAIAVPMSPLKGMTEYRVTLAGTSTVPNSPPVPFGRDFTFTTGKANTY